MASTMGEVREGIRSRLAAVSGIGKVHKRVRWFDTRAGLDDVAKSDGGLHVWFVTNNTGPVNVSALDHLSTKQRVYHYQLVGFMQVSDADETELDWETVCQAIITAFSLEDARKLIGLSGIIVAGPANWSEGGHRMYPAGTGGVLCHFAKIDFAVRVQTQP